MQTILSKWRATALCCIPTIVLAAIVGIGIATGSTTLGTFFSGPLALGLILLALLVCPLHMGWMMWRMQKRHGLGKRSILPVGCCTPGKHTSSVQVYSSERVQALRSQRRVLEQEVSALQQAR